MSFPHNNGRRTNSNWRSRPSNPGYHRHSPSNFNAPRSSPSTSPGTPSTRSTRSVSPTGTWRQRSPLISNQSIVEPHQQQQQQGLEGASVQWQSWNRETPSNTQNNTRTNTSLDSGWNMSSSSSSNRDTSLHKDSDDTNSIWNDDWDDNNDFPTPHLDNPITTTTTHDHLERSGWSPEPPEDTPSSSLAATKTTGLIPDPVIQSPPPPPPLQQQPPPPPPAVSSGSLSYQGDEIIKHEFFLARGRKDSRNISIDDILVRTIRRKGSPAIQHIQSPSISSPPPNGVNASPFMYPSYVGTPSTDHYNQYKNEGKLQQRTKDGSTYRSQKPPAFTGAVHSDDQYQPIYKSYPSIEDMEEKVSIGELHRGVLRINRRNRYDSYVTVENLDEDVYIGGELLRNRAFDGDVVAVRLLDVDDVWNKRKEKQRKSGAGNGSYRMVEAPAGMELFMFEEEQVEQDDEDLTKPKYAGEVIGILDQPEERVTVGYLQIEQNTSNYNDSQGLYHSPPQHVKRPKIIFRPLDTRTPLLMIHEKDAPQDFMTRQSYYTSTLLVAKMVEWSIYKRRPKGKIMKVLGMVGDMKVETDAILARSGIKMKPYPSVARDALPKIPWTIPEDEISKRTDYRSHITFSIDPDTAKDLDDILHIKRLEDGGFQVGVHIADVSYFIPAHTPLDTEARERATSTYLVNDVIPMLPVTLAEELCSLNPGKDRLAFSVVWEMDDEANIRSTWFGKTVVCSRAKLSYNDAQQVLEGGQLPQSASLVDPNQASDIETSIKDLMALARHLRKRRFANGALALESVKLTFDFDEEGEPTAVSNFEAQDSNKLIEEFMLLANTHVAQKISSAYNREALLRRHAPPILRRMDIFVEEAKSYGYHIDASSAGALQASLENIPDGPVKQVLLMLIIKPMQRAKYFASGALDITKFLHYALNEQVYTHFTSPIRRYADILVHRQLNNALKGMANSGYSTKTVQMIAYSCNYRREMSKVAEEMSRHLYLARYLNRTQKETIKTAVVMAVTEHHFDVYLHEYGLQRRLFAQDYPLDNYDYCNDDASLVLYWERGVPVDMESQFKRHYQRDTMRTTDIKSREDMESKNKGKSKANNVTAPMGQSITSVRAAPLDHTLCSQRLAIFTTLQVKLEVNSHRSPPVINMYPVNPFC